MHYYLGPPFIWKVYAIYYFQSKKKREPNFSNDELETLVDLVDAKKTILNAKFKGIQIYSQTT